MKLLVMLGSIGLLSACSSVEPPMTAQVLPGILRVADSSAQIMAPDIAHAGVPFTVSVVTFDRNCRSAFSTEIARSSSAVELRPLDLDPGSDVVCIAELRTLLHSASITIDQPGAVTISAVGVALPSGSDVRVTRVIQVQ